LWPVVEQCVAICQPLAQARGVMLSMPAPERGDADLRDTWVRADPTHLRQVLMNLLSNAIKYNQPQGQVRIAVHREVAGDGQPDIQLSVADTGAGLAPAQIAGLFQPFNRLGAEDSGIEGHGLGLSISRALAQAMGGDITVRSQPDSDTCFTLLLHSTAPMPVALQHAAAPALAAPPDRPALRVLYIEDNALNMLLMRQIVALRPGLKFFEAVDGESGVLAVQVIRPDLVLIDIGLPLLDGFGVRQRLRDAARTADIVCWAVTADTTPETAAQAQACGFQRLVTKPLNVAAMLEALDGWVRDRQAAPTSASA
jgi:CheY-like chemotaxis protein